MPVPLLFALTALVLAVPSALYWLTRDPERHGPRGPGLILAPADGTVLLVEQTSAPCWMTGPAWRIAIFLSLFDVHVQRSPMAGRIAYSERQPGGHYPAMQGRAAANAGHWLGLEGANGPLLVLRTAGRVARRVTATAALGAELDQAQRIGRILLGSRTEVYLPLAARPIVSVGQHVRAGETVIARWSASEPPR